MISEWANDAPAGWQVGRLKTTVAYARNGIWGEEATGIDDVRCVRVADFDRTLQRISNRDVTYRSIAHGDRKGRLLRPGDLLLEKSGGGEKSPVGFVVLVDENEPAVCSNFVARVVLKPGMDPRFWTYVHGALYGLRITERSIKQSTGIQNLDQASYLNERVLIPPPADQQAIADYLDRETAQIDAFIAKNEELISLLTERRKAVVSRLLGSAFPDVAVRHVVRLIQTGPFGSQLHAEDYVQGGRPLINPMHMIDGRAVPSPDVGVSEDKARELSRHQLRADDLVLARRGELGRSALITKDDAGYLCGTGSMLVRPNPSRVLARYLQLVIGSERSRSTLREKSVGSTMENLNTGAIGVLRIPLPSLNEQSEILRNLDRSNAQIEAAIHTAQRSIELARERRAALISAAVTGKIDVGVAA